MNLFFSKLLKEEVSSSLSHMLCRGEMIFTLRWSCCWSLWNIPQHRTFKSDLVHAGGQEQLTSVYASQEMCGGTAKATNRPAGQQESARCATDATSGAGRVFKTLVCAKIPKCARGGRGAEAAGLNHRFEA